jgi:N-carbamoyl-L-amino-acid hydrolase
MTVTDTPIDPARVLRDLNVLRRIGAFKTGVHRPSLTSEHIASLQWLIEAARAADLTGTIDGIGNVLCASRVSGAKLLAGSHLESQRQAGWLDGPLGIVYALEAARVLNRHSSFADRAVEIACWCDEEGHFGHFLGSRSYVGKVTDAEVAAAVDRTDGRRMADALAAAGLAGRPRITAPPGRHCAFLEAHIEQGDWLEANALKIGVVTSIVGIWQFKVSFEGVQNHAGTTRMAIRRDAGLACAKLCVAIDQAFPKAAGARTVWTTGRITLEPGAPSIIPGRAEMLFQIRDADVSILERLEALLRELALDADRSGPVRVSVERLRASMPAVMDAKLQDIVARAAERHAPGQVTAMPSAAGHDAGVLSEIVPAAMLFVPSIGGISHHWTENTSDEDIILGAQVFCDAAAAILGSH